MDLFRASLNADLGLLVILTGLSVCALWRRHGRR
jgi:hypothetical protein